MSIGNSNNELKEKLNSFLDYHKTLFNLKRKIIKKLKIMMKLFGYMKFLMRRNVFVF